MSNNLKLINTNTINSKPIRNYIKVKNTGGPKGDKGDTGATGPQGPQGPAGQAATINIGETTTLLPGQTATVTNTGTQQNATLNFGIPQGLRGPTGAQGPKGDTGPQGLKGDKGNDGAAASVTVGITNTGEPGSNASVTNLGTSSNAILSFTIPTGSRGPQGQTGPQGPKGEDGKDGEKGDKGDAGQAATVTVGSTTTTNPGTSATVTNSGTTSAAVLNFGIPRGATGSVKSEVVSELPETGEGDTFYLVNREATTQTATGKTINFTNSENSGDITDAQIDGETSQNGTPTPSAPVAVNTVTGENVVKICGKNLFDKAAATLNYRIGSDGSPYGDNNFFLSEFIPVNPSSSYRITPTSGGGSSAVAYYDSSRTFISRTMGGTWYNVSTPANAAYIRFTTLKTLIDSTQLELGSTATTYEPYQGQSFEVNLGKNLYSKSDNQILSAYIDNEHSAITGNSYNRIVWIKCEPNTTYTASRITPPYWGRSLAWTEEVPGIGVQTYGYVQSDNKEIKITTGGTAQYLVYRCYQGNNDSSLTLDDVLDSIKIQSEPIELVNYWTYRDYIYKSGGKWYKHATMGKQIVNTNDITLVSSYANAEYGTFPKMSDAATYNNYTHYGGYCTHGIIKGDPQGGWNQASNAGAVYDTPVNVRWWVGFAKGTGIDAIRATLEGCTLYYPLAVPTDIEITDQAIIEQLDNLASAALYSGTNNIFTVTANEVPTLEIDYVTYDKYNQNKVYIYNEATGVWQIIVQ